MDLAAFLLLCAALGQLAFWGRAYILPAAGRLAEGEPAPYPLAERPPYTVALDAGHGGGDCGARVRATGMREVEVCEQTVAALAALLEEDTAFCPVRTRADGEGAAIRERTRAAAAARADLLLSVHANHDPGHSQSHGFECFPTPPGREWAGESMRFAQALAARMGEAGHRLRGSGGVRFAYYSGKSKIIVDAEDERVRTLKSFGILEQALCPAVLAEQCFLGNAGDIRDWTGPAGCARAAEAYYRAVCDYFGLEPHAARPPYTLEGSGTFDPWRQGRGG